MMKKVFLVNLLLFFSICLSQNKEPYAIFDANGKKQNYNKLLQKSLDVQVVLFGEFHDNSIIHWLQIEIAKDVFARKPLILGAEMMEADGQNFYNQYLDGQFSYKKLDSLVKLWPNFKTDYKPLLDFAKANKIKFVATNIPRRFASLVFKKDLPSLETLSLEEKSWIAPLPIAFDLELPGYKSMLGMQGGHAGDKMPKAQAIKDATMAHFIEKNLLSNSVFLHFNGTYHSENFEGINWYLKKQMPDIKILTIATVVQKEIKTLEKENLGKADFIIVVDQDATKTY